MNCTVLNFGKHKGKTLPQVIFDDADWFFYGYESGYFKNGLAIEAQEIYRKARSIRVPQRNGQKMLVEYVIDRKTGKFATMGLIPARSGLDHLRVSPVIDFHVPRSCAPHDKIGCKNLVFAFKAIYFGDVSHRMNRQAREDFFNDNDNFDLD